MLKIQEGAMEEAKRPRIVLTGGGTAGHVTPLLAILPELKTLTEDLLYIGSYGGIEAKLAKENGLSYRGVSTGKLRRSFSLKNLSDLFRVFFGFLQAFFALLQFRPDLVLSKGGFVSVPVCLAAALLRIPVCTHESDMTPGLATRIISRFATRVLCNFPPTLKSLPASKSSCVGLPLRKELFSGKRESGYRIADLDPNSEKPLVLVIGGSSGAKFINDLVSSSLTQLLARYQIMHILGPQNNSSPSRGSGGYSTFEYVGVELPHLFACADLVISRAGATTICELAALGKKMLLIPLSRGSRGDQLVNAAYFSKLGLAGVLSEEQANTVSLLAALETLHATVQTPQTAAFKSGNEAFLREALSLIGR